MGWNFVLRGFSGHWLLIWPLILVVPDGGFIVTVKELKNYLIWMKSDLWESYIFFKFSSALLDPPYGLLKIWRRIRNQQPEKLENWCSDRWSIYRSPCFKGLKIFKLWDRMWVIFWNYIRRKSVKYLKVLMTSHLHPLLNEKIYGVSKMTNCRSVRESNFCHCRVRPLQANNLSYNILCYENIIKKH